ncbi:hypothetical protein EE612_001847, partial [Oryza sativa]
KVPQLVIELQKSSLKAQNPDIRRPLTNQNRSSGSFGGFDTGFVPTWRLSQR